MNRLLATTCLFAACALPAPAADESPRPKEPLLPAMPERSAWVLEFGTSKAPAKGTDDTAAEKQPNPDANKITISKDGTTYRVTSAIDVGGYREAWVIGGTVFLVVPGTDRCALVDATFFPETDFSKGDFEAFEWVRPADYTGVVDLGGQKVFGFEADSLKRPLSARESANVTAIRKSMAGDGDLSGDPAKPVSDDALLHALGWGPKFNAWLDPVTQRPLALESGDLHIRVRYLPDPGPLTPPASVIQRIDAIRKEQQRLQKRPTRPKR